jgi:hypothetical protein
MRKLFISALDQDSEWNMKPILDQAWKAWEQSEQSLRLVYEKVNKDEDEPLEAFMTQVADDCHINQRAAKLLYDVQTCEINHVDVAIFMEEEVEGEFKVTRTYKGLSFKDTSPKGYAHTYHAIVYFDGELDKIYYGDDVTQMRESITKVYTDDFKRGPEKIVFGRRI